MASPGELLSDQEEDAAVPPCCGGHILSHRQGQCRVSYGPDLVHCLEPVTERCCTLVTTGGHEAGRRHIQAEQPKESCVWRLLGSDSWWHQAHGGVAVRP